LGLFLDTINKSSYAKNKQPDVALKRCKYWIIMYVIRCLHDPANVQQTSNKRLATL